MANVLYDIPLTERLDLTFGVGAGVDRAEFEPPAFWGGDDDDWNFAYQGIAGLSYAITNRLDLTLTYRYLHVDAPEFSVPGGPNPTPEHWAFDDLEKHTVTVGLRYDLYEDEAPLPPPLLRRRRRRRQLRAEAVHHLLRLQQVQHHGGSRPGAGRSGRRREVGRRRQRADRRPHGHGRFGLL